MLWHWQLLQLGQPEDPMSASAEVPLGFSLGVLSTVVDLNLFEVEIGWKGELGGNIRPVKATVLQIMAIYPLPCLNYSPNQLQTTTIWAPKVGRHSQAGCLPRWAMR